MAPETLWTWQVTFETATIRSGRATSQAAAEHAASAEHDRLVVRGLNPDSLAYFVNPPVNNGPADTNREALAKRIAAEVVRQAGARNIARGSAEIVWFLEDLNDLFWFHIRKAVKADHPVSDETKRAVRELLLDGLSVEERLKLLGPCGEITVDELVISEEGRTELRQRALDRALATHESARSEP